MLGRYLLKYWYSLFKRYTILAQEDKRSMGVKSLGKLDKFVTSCGFMVEWGHVRGFCGLRAIF